MIRRLLIVAVLGVSLGAPLAAQNPAAVERGLLEKMKADHVPGVSIAIVDNYRVVGFPGYAMGAPLPTVPQVLDGAPPANTAAVRNDDVPGAHWVYSGGGITIAQLMATDVTGESFPALMRRLVLAPTGMTRSTHENPLPQARWTEAATGHEKPDTPVPGHFHVYPEMAAAGLWTTATRSASATAGATRGSSR
jgi:CubicO group peptidase (beta-lactamase class C family)